jgi:hypothetical protein
MIYYLLILTDDESHATFFLPTIDCKHQREIRRISEALNGKNDLFCCFFCHDNELSLNLFGSLTVVLWLAGYWLRRMPQATNFESEGRMKSWCVREGPRS